MVIRLILRLASVSALLLSSPHVAAEPLPRLSAAVVCMPAANDQGNDARPGHFCLLRLPAWFDGASVEVTPRGAITAKAVMKRLGAELELKF